MCYRVSVVDNIIDVVMKSNVKTQDLVQLRGRNTAMFLTNSVLQYGKTCCFLGSPFWPPFHWSLNKTITTSISALLKHTNKNEISNGYPVVQVTGYQVVRPSLCNLIMLNLDQKMTISVCKVQRKCLSKQSLKHFVVVPERPLSKKQACTKQQLLRSRPTWTTQWSHTIYR